MGEKDIMTYGFELKPIIAEARANGNNDFADLVETCLENINACYRIVAMKHTSTGENLWNIDAGALKGMLK